MRLLVVEDDHRIAAALKKGLEQERFAVDLAYTGLDAYDLVTTEPYDLIVLDIMIPGLDGISFTKKVRSDGKHVPILMLTAKSQTKDKVTGLNSGADDYLTKPFSFEELLARIHALIRRPKESLGPHLSLDTLTIDTIRTTVIRSDKIISLSSKEYALLVYLMRNKYRTLSKEQIISHVWDYNADILPNTVEAFVKNLRKKIDDPFPSEKKLLKTIRGFGYTLTDL